MTRKDISIRATYEMGVAHLSAVFRREGGGFVNATLDDFYIRFYDTTKYVFHEPEWLAVKTIFESYDQETGTLKGRIETTDETFYLGSLEIRLYCTAERDIRGLGYLKSRVTFKEAKTDFTWKVRPEKVAVDGDKPTKIDITILPPDNWEAQNFKIVTYDSKGKEINFPFTLGDYCGNSYEIEDLELNKNSANKVYKAGDVITLHLLAEKKGTNTFFDTGKEATITVVKESEIKYFDSSASSFKITPKVINYIPKF